MANCDTFRFIVTVIFVLIKAGCPQQVSVCSSIIAKLDCSQDPPSPLCGSEGVTFQTRCDFAKAHCADSNMHLVHEGECLQSERPVSDPICPQLLRLTCPTASSLHVCASDGHSYTHLCSFEQARCLSPELKLVSVGPCVNKVLQLICDAIRHEKCPEDRMPVCGSDSVTYDNACKLEKAACDTPGLHLVDDHPC